MAKKVDFTKFDIDDLLEMQQELKKIIDEKMRVGRKAIYKHGCHSASNHHLNKYKHWSKLITSVDDSKNNGYAFGGEFLKVTASHNLPVGSLVVEVCHNEVKLMRTTEKDFTYELIATARTNDMIDLIRKASDMLCG